MCEDAIAASGTYVRDRLRKLSTNLSGRWRGRSGGRMTSTKTSDEYSAAGCTEDESADMHISDAAGGPEPGSEPCRFPKLEECAHFHYERVQLPRLSVVIQTNMDQSLHSQHSHDDGGDGEWHMLQVTSGDECWLLQRNLENFRMLDSQLHQCIFDRKISQLTDLCSSHMTEADAERTLVEYLERFCEIADNSINCGPVLNWLQMDNKGHRLLVPSEESRSINTPAVAAAYSVRRYVSQARDELNLEVGDMISVIDMASPGESIWWRGKRGFQVGFFPQHCVHIIGDKVPRNMPLPAPVVGSLALSPIKPVLRKHGKLIAFFRSFILNRPSRRRLKQTGILKERVFGCDLGEHLLNSGHEIPTVLKCCAEFIETHGIVDGIYRLSGVTSNIQKLRNAFDEDRIPNLYTEDILQDIHSVASLLKMYFRELPNPLCTYQLYQSFVNAVQGCNTSIRNSETDHERLLKMREAVQKLPPPHYRTLEYLMRHLAKVAKHGSRTGMTTRNVAIVWAPNLLRCAELEVGGVAALQGVGVQAVVTEFLICYTDLIFCDNLPNLDRPILETCMSSPKRSRPKSLAISTPTKLITLEEARSKHLLNKDCGYIEVGGGPDSLPKKYHTIIELPPGTRKRGLAKRSPMGWRSFFTKSRNSTQGVLAKPRKASTPGVIVAVSSSSTLGFDVLFNEITIEKANGNVTAEKAVTESDLTDMRRKLRTVKSAESLTSGHSEPAVNDVDILGPLHTLNKPPGHNRSVSHDSYFDTLQSSHNNSEGSLLDLSEIQLNFELEESEMRIFSEDESLVSSPRIQRDGCRRLLNRPRHEEYLSANNSANPSPKKQARVVLSPESLSRKRTRLEDQLSDIQFIDCNTPDNSNTFSMSSTTTAVVHSEDVDGGQTDSYQPRNKSPRNSDIPNLRSEASKRQSLNLEKCSGHAMSMPKSLTEVDISSKASANHSTTSTPQSPMYRPLVDSSTTTPGDYSPSVELLYQKLNKCAAGEVLKAKSPYEIMSSPTKKAPTVAKSPTYENVLTTISITYKSPTKSYAPNKPSSLKDSVYEDVNITTESAQVPTSTANLPVQQAKEPDAAVEEKRPKSFNDLESLRKKTPPGKTESEIDTLFANLKSSVDNTSLTDLSLSEVVNSSSEYINSNRTSISLPLTPTRGTLSPNVSPTEFSQDLLTPTSLTTSKNASRDSLSASNNNEEVKNSSEESTQTSEEPLVEDSDSFPKCDTTLSELYETYDQMARANSSEWENSHYENVKESEPLIVEKEAPSEDAYESVEFKNGDYENVQYREKPLELDILERPRSINLIEFSPMTEESGARSPNNEKRKQAETTDDSVYQQVKYFRKSVHEINALLDLEKGDEGNSTEATFDSLESDVTHAYENCNVPTNNTYENVDFSSDSLETKADEPLDKVDVKSLTSKFEGIRGSKKARDGLPPCLRARNLKNAIKTRSLDEDEFRKEFAVHGLNRRKSFDENLGYKINTLPKSLNKPKKLPPEDPDLAQSIESIHDNHHLLTTGNLSRERIEKYKEERRKFLHNKYRSESFKEDKDVLLSRFKVFKPKEEDAKLEEAKRTPNKADAKRKTEVEIKIVELDTSPLPSIESIEVVKEEALVRSPKRSSIKSKTAIFEGAVKKEPEVELRTRRNRDVIGERHRHTFETRERETPDGDGNRRISLDSKPPRKEKTSPSYCIKDMKAIFESKSHQ